MTVRSAEQADLPVVMKLMQCTPWDKTEYLTRQLALGNILLAAEGEKIFGFIVWNREFFALPFVWLVVVAPKYQRRGIASQLFEHVERRCAGGRLYSSTNDSHQVMHAFFAKRGYRKAGAADIDPGDEEIIYRKDV